MIEIKHRLTGRVMITLAADTLAKAYLAGAYLAKANLVSADLSRADLSCANLVYADLSEANLSVANLYRANLIRAKLTGANLCRADLTAANLRNADFSCANLAGAIVAHGYVCNGGYVAYPKIGSRDDTLHVFLTNKGPCVRTGCFAGTLDEFSDAVEITHEYNSGHRGDYQRVIAEIREALK